MRGSSRASSCTSSSRAIRPARSRPTARARRASAVASLKTEQVGGRTVTWYDHNLASHTGHIAAIFHAGGNIYVISIHVASPVSTAADAKTDLRHIIRSLAPVRPGG